MPATSIQTMFDTNMPVGVNNLLRWNPFAHLRETKKYPLGRLLRSGIWRRIEDTIQVFYGNFHDNDENQLGIVDYLFPVPRISEYILYKAFQVSSIVFVLASILAIPFIAIKFIAVFTLTLISLPFVGLTHIFIMPTINKLSDRIQHLKITSIKSEENQHELGQVFSTEKMRSFLIMPIEKANPDGLALGIYEGRWKLDENPISRSKYPKAIIEVTPENQKGIKALLKTNMFKTTQYVEENGLTDILEQKLIERFPSPIPPPSV